MSILEIIFIYTKICDVPNKFVICFFTIVISIAILFVSGYHASNLLVKPAYAHITKQIGNMKIEVGWLD